MSDRIEEIRSRFTAALQAAKAQRDRQSQGFIIPCMEHTEAIRKWEAHIPADLEFLLAEVDRQSAQLSRIKAAFLHAGCSDYTDDVARMAEEFLAQGEEG